MWSNPSEAAFCRLARFMLSAERFGMECLLAVCNMWAAHKLTTPPSNFQFYESGYAFMKGLQIHEPDWGLFAAISAMLTALGLTLLALRVVFSTGLVMRCIGLLMSGFFWTLMGCSFLIGNPDSVAAVPLILLGASAWWTLIRFPTVPRCPSP